MSILQVQSVNKSFSGLRALRDVNLNVEEGSVHAIIGPNGAGKSTLLNCFVGRLTPDTGTVLFDGRSLIGLAPHAINQAGVVRVFQTPEIFGDLSLLENVMIPCLLAGWARARARERARELLDAVGLSARVRHRPGKLSGGERQRVAIARALAMSPPLLLADEPTGNLDPHTAEAVEERLLALNAQVRTSLVLVTHNEKLASRLAKKTYLVEGRLRS